MASAVVASVVVNHQSSQTNIPLLFSFLLTRIIIIVICPYFPVYAYSWKYLLGIYTFCGLLFIIKVHKCSLPIMILSVVGGCLNALHA